MERLKANQDLLSGLLLMALGGLFGFLARNLKMGTPSSMGAGFVPIILSGSLVLIGLLLALRAYWVREATDAWPSLRVLVIVCLAPLVFGGLLRVVGLVVTVVVTALFARLAMPGRPGWVDVVSACVLSAFCAITFVVLLGQSLPLWP